MYTSGSTGQPKGVEIRHRSIVRFVFGNGFATFGAGTACSCSLRQCRSMLPPSNCGRAAARCEAGRCAVGLPDFRQLEDVLKRNGVTTLWLTSTLFNQVVDTYPQALNSVDEILTGGEALSVRHMCKAQAALGSRVKFINGYGPTESTTFATCYRVPSNVPADLESIPIGRPIANTQVYVLDKLRQPVPIGVPGELYIGGAGLARAM